MEAKQKKTLTEQFQEFHEANPWVAAKLTTIALKLLLRGKKRFGIKFLWEVMRWDYIMDPTHDPNSDFLLNNNYHSRYARLLHDTVPELREAFEFRKLHSE